MELARSTKPNISLAAQIEVLSYTYSGTDPIEVFARVDLGSGTAVLSGLGGNYQLDIYLNGVPIEPSSAVLVPAGTSKAIMTSRQIAINSGDVISLRVTGLTADTNVTTTASLRDATPIVGTDVFGGGSRLVNQDYGGIDALAAQAPAGNRLDGVTIRAYRQSDYQAGNYTEAYVVGTTTTDVNGSWVNPLMLDPGTYVLVFYLQGQYGPNTVTITVV